MTKIVVTYPNGAERTRYVQSTVRPTEQQIGSIDNFNDWAIHIGIMSDIQFGARTRMNMAYEPEILLNEAKAIINGKGGQAV